MATTPETTHLNTTTQLEVFQPSQAADGSQALEKFAAHTSQTWVELRSPRLFKVEEVCGRPLAVQEFRLSLN